MKTQFLILLMGIMTFPFISKGQNGLCEDFTDATQWNIGDTVTYLFGDVNFPVSTNGGNPVTISANGIIPGTDTISFSSTNGRNHVIFQLQGEYHQYHIFDPTYYIPLSLGINGIEYGLIFSYSYDHSTSPYKNFTLDNNFLVEIILGNFTGGIQDFELRITDVNPTNGNQSISEVSISTILLYSDGITTSTSILQTCSSVGINNDLTYFSVTADCIPLQDVWYNIFDANGDSICGSYIFGGDDDTSYLAINNSSGIAPFSLVFDQTEVNSFNLQLDSLSYQINNNGIISYCAAISELSLDDLKNEMNVTLFPNPATDFVELKADNDIEKIEIYSADGKLCLTTYPNSTSTKINVTDFTSGMYVVRLNSIDSSNTIRMIKK